MKGAHLLPGLAAAAASADGGFRLCVQAFSAGDDAEAPRQLGQVRRWAAKSPEAVRLLQQPMSVERYRRVLQGCAVVMLPYLASAYRVASSAVFCEAVAAGRPVIVPEDTWMSGVLRRFGAKPATFTSWSVPAILASLRAVLADLAQRRAEAARLASAWNTANGPERLIDRLEEWQRTA
jgi:hypothetical protein